MLCPESEVVFDTADELDRYGGFLVPYFRKLFQVLQRKPVLVEGPENEEINLGAIADGLGVHVASKRHVEGCFDEVSLPGDIPNFPVAPCREGQDSAGGKRKKESFHKLWCVLLLIVFDGGPLVPAEGNVGGRSVGISGAESKVCRNAGNRHQDIGRGIGGRLPYREFNDIRSVGCFSA